jgi:hypothetical protein
MRRGALVLLALSLQGCLVYEYEHEFWLNVDGSGRVFVTGQPSLWTAFKGLGSAADPEGTATRESARALFEKAGLRVRRATVTRRRGRPYLFISADFDDVRRLGETEAFPDLDVDLRTEGDRLRLEGSWHRPSPAPIAGVHPAGLMAVRFHLPSKVYEHRNAADGVERGNIVAWRQEVAAGLRGEAIVFGAVIDRRSILWSTVGLFAGAIVLALTTLAAIVYILVRRGRAASGAVPASRS